MLVFKHLPEAPSIGTSHQERRHEEWGDTGIKHPGTDERDKGHAATYSYVGTYYMQTTYCAQAALYSLSPPGWRRKGSPTFTTGDRMVLRGLPDGYGNLDIPAAMALRAARSKISITDYKQPLSPPTHSVQSEPQTSHPQASAQAICFSRLFLFNLYISCTQSVSSLDTI